MIQDTPVAAGIQSKLRELVGMFRLGENGEIYVQLPPLELLNLEELRDNLFYENVAHWGRRIVRNAQMPDCLYSSVAQPLEESPDLGMRWIFKALHIWQTNVEESVLKINEVCLRRII